jgi:hypothetical protein
MDHLYIEEHNIIARYEMRKLSPADCAGFEEHMVDCPSCQSQLAEAEEFRQGFREVAAENPVQRPVFEPVPAWLGWITNWRVMLATAAVCLVLFGVSLLLLVNQRRDFNTQLSEAQHDAREWQDRYESANQTAAEMSKQLDESKSRVSLASAKPFPLITVRGDNQRPVNFVVLPRGAQWVFLAPDINEDRVLRYRATLSDSGGHIVWEENHPVPSKGVEIGLPPGLLHRADYVLTLAVHDQRGQDFSYRYPFSVKSSE